MSEIKIRPSELADTEALFAMLQESIETTCPVQGWCCPGDGAKS